MRGSVEPTCNPSRSGAGVVVNKSRKGYHLCVTVPEAPHMNTADNRNRWVRQREKKRIYDMVAALTLGHRPRKPLAKALVMLTRCTAAGKCPDFDNLVQGGKHIVDGLVKCGVLADDNQDVIGQPEYRWVRGEPNRACVVVEVWG